MVCMRQNIDEAESPQILANYLGKVIRQKLEEIENQEDRVNLINNILKEAGIIDEIQIAEPSKLLTEVIADNKHYYKQKVAYKLFVPSLAFA